MSGHRTRLVLLSALLGTLTSSLGQLIVATSMPVVARQLNGLSQISWVYSAYMLASAISIPILGKLSDIYGRRNIYIIGIALFLAGSTLCGLAANMAELILFRSLQGTGGGAMVVGAVAIIGDIFPPAERGKWQGANTSVFALATVAGPMLGGWICENLTWRWTFFVNIPFGVLAIVLAATQMPCTARTAQARSVDLVGAMTMAVGLLALLLVLAWGGSRYPWGSWQILALGATLACGLVALVMIERKAHEPVLSLALFRSRVYSISLLAALFTMTGMYGVMLYVPVFVQGVIGVSATGSGMTLMPMMIAMILASLIGGQVMSRTGRYKVLAIVAMVITVLGMALLASIGPSTTSIELSWRLVVLGVGLGVGTPILVTVSQSAFGPERLGEVTAGYQLFRSVGGAIGTALLGGVMNSRIAALISGLQGDPFVAELRQLSPAALPRFDAGGVEKLLGIEAQTQIRATISQAAGAVQAELFAGLDRFLQAVKDAFSLAVGRVYLVGTGLLLVALALVIFLPEIPLRRARTAILPDAGAELAHQGKATAGAPNTSGD